MHLYAFKWLFYALCKALWIAFPCAWNMLKQMAFCDRTQQIQTMPLSTAAIRTDRHDDKAACTDEVTSLTRWCHANNLPSISTSRRQRSRSSTTWSRYSKRACSTAVVPKHWVGTHLWATERFLWVPWLIISFFMGLLINYIHFYGSLD